MGPSRAILLILSLLAAWVPGAGASAQQAIEDLGLAGVFTWSTLDGVPTPVEFPSGSGIELIAGTLELTPTDVSSSEESRFSLRFTSRVPARDGGPQTSGEDGTFSVAADTLLFLPDGRESAQPVRLVYHWLADGGLGLRDAAGNVWEYRRAP